MSLLLLFKGGTSAQTLTPDLYTNTQTFYGPTITTTYTLSPDLFTNTQTFFAPTVTATYDLTPALYTNTQTFYSATVSQTGAAQNLTPDLYTNTQTFYSATVTTGPVTLQPSLYTNTQTFFAATVAPGPVDLLPLLYTNTQSFYAAVVTVDGGPQYLLPDLFTNTQTFYGPTVAQVSPQPQEQFDGDIAPRVRRKRKQREFDEERKTRDELRELIKRAVDPVKEQTAQATVLASQQDAEVAIVTGATRSIDIPVPPNFNAAEVAQMVAAELERQNVAVRREQARQALETMIREERARIVKRQREDEEILLFS